MVAGKNMVSGGADILSIGSKTTVKTSNKTKKNNDTDFKTMLDKNAQNTQDTQGPQNAETPKADAPSKEQAPENSTAVPKDEETVEENGMELEVLAQFAVIPTQERAALNWAEETPMDGAVKAAAVEGVDEAEAGAVQTGAQQADAQATLTKDEAGLSGQEAKNAGNGAETGKTVETQGDTAEVRQADAGKDANQNVRVQDAVETEKPAAVERTDAKAWAEGTQEAGREETKTAQDLTAHTAAPKAAEDDGVLNFKVGDAVKVSEPNAAQNIADTILVRAGENNREFEMQLNPEELGTVKIKMVFEEGKIHIAMTCDNQKAMDLLSSTSSKLKELIEDRTGSEVNIHVDQENETPYHEQEKQGGRGNEQQDANHRQDAKNSAEPMDFIQQLRLGLLDAE